LQNAVPIVKSFAIENSWIPPKIKEKREGNCTRERIFVQQISEIFPQRQGYLDLETEFRIHLTYSAFLSGFWPSNPLPGRRSILSMKGFRCGMKITNPAGWFLPEIYARCPGTHYFGSLICLCR